MTARYLRASGCAPGWRSVRGPAPRPRSTHQARCKRPALWLCTRRRVAVAGYFWDTWASTNCWVDTILMSCQSPRNVGWLDAHGASGQEQACRASMYPVNTYHGPFTCEVQRSVRASIPRSPVNVFCSRAVNSAQLAKPARHRHALRLAIPGLPLHQPLLDAPGESRFQRGLCFYFGDAICRRGMKAITTKTAVITAKLMVRGVDTKIARSPSEMANARRTERSKMPPST